MKELTYEEASLKLEKLVSELEKGDLSLEDTVKKYNEATKLSGYCAALLNNAKLKITKLSQEEENEG